MHSFNNRLKAWLATQCQMLGDVSAAILVQLNEGTANTIAKWPNADASSEPLQILLTRAIAKQRLQLEQSREGSYRFAQPLMIDGMFWGVIALEIRLADKKALTAALKEIKLGQFWLQFLLHQQPSTNEQQPAVHPISSSAYTAQAADQLSVALPLAVKLLKENSLQEVAISLVNTLASQLGALRVSLGLLHKQNLKLQAVSNSANFDPRTQAMQVVNQAMQEALEQGMSVTYSLQADSQTGGLLVRAHQQLLQLQQVQAVSSFPLRKNDRLVGVLTVELDKHTQLSTGQQAFVEAVLPLCGGVIALWQDASAGVSQRFAQWLGARAQRWLGAENWLGRSVALGLALLLVAMFIPATYRVTADALLQATEKYLVVAPHDGYLGDVLVRPGDSVKKSSPLASLKDDDLLLERRKLASQVQRYRQAYDAALANADRVEAAIANAQMDQASIQLRLIEQQLQRTKLLAPIDGILVSDDISQKQGAPLKQGDLLFELAAANEYRVQMFVDERDIAAIAIGQTAQVKFTSLPNQMFTAQVKTITPISEVREGRNYFRVELFLVGNDAQTALEILRPGMTGSGKIHIGKRALGWIWFHDLWYWLRLNLW